MVQILPPNRPTFGEHFAGGVEKGLSQASEMQKLAQKAALERQAQAEKLSASSKAEEQNYNKIKQAFGEQFADVWKASPTGARTALETAAIQQGLRKLPIGGLFGEEAEVSQDMEMEEELGERPLKKKVKSLSIKTPSGEDFQLPKISVPESMTPSETVKYQSSLRKENSPIFTEAKEKRKGLKREKDRFSILNNLNKKMPDGIGRAFINKEGNIRPFAQILKLVPPEAERFVKTINDFITNAKDVFGARVTNYDLQSFKSRLPTLINSSEGRKQIIRQMEVFNEMEQNYYDTLDKVYKHYGLGNISQEEAESIAEQMVTAKEEQLRAELESIDQPDFEMESMPDPRENVGRIIEDDQGRRFRSNGFDWEPI